MGKIIVLDELTINQIAAGEVIERPASVVKELIENSIDAGATSINIEVKNGGIKQIKIIDNGTGIAKDDLEFAFERHATSKIKSAIDLETVKSMGFRGEALASIAAISHIELITKTEEDFLGNRIVVEGGEIIEQEETGAQKGTTIIVSNLFYNTPVRYKFLKKDYTELGYIEDAVTRIALANPNIAIKLSNENKTIIQTNGNGDIRTAIYGIYGKETSDALIDINYQYEDILVTGVIGKPEIARNNRTYQMFFINKRYIKDKTLSAGVEQAFKGLLPIGKFGFLILNLEISPNKIDVNVHPTKLEIRFQEEQKVFKAVYHSIREGLLQNDLVKSTEYAQKDYKQENKYEENKEKEEHIEQENIEHIKDIIEPENKIQLEDQKTQKFEPIEEIKEDKPTGLFGLFKRKTEEEKEEILEEKNPIGELFEYKNTIGYNTTPIKTEEYIEKNAVDFDKMYSQTFGVKKEDREEETEKIKEYTFADSKNLSVFEDSEEYKEIPPYKYCGTVFSTYLIIEMGTEMYIIDQHAAHERIMYEKIKKNYYQNKEKESQIMLLPDIITLSHKEKAIVKENIELFNKAGFTLEEFGENTIRLVGVPAICMEMDTKELFLEILDSIDTVAITAKQEKEDKFIATIACKAAVKANMALTKEEVDNLMKELLVLPNPFTCPHGRPTAIKMEKTDIEKKFNRRK